jgi:hypothetical protein
MRVSRTKGTVIPDKWLTVPVQRKRAITRWLEAQRSPTRPGRSARTSMSRAWSSDRHQPRAGGAGQTKSIERGEIDGIVVAKVDRFSRDLPYGAMIARRVEKAGGTFVAADDGVVLGPAGRELGGDETAYLLFGQLLNMSDFFRQARQARLAAEPSTGTSTSAGGTGGRRCPLATGRQRTVDSYPIPSGVRSSSRSSSDASPVTGPARSLVGSLLEARRPLAPASPLTGG